MFSFSHSLNTVGKTARPALKALLFSGIFLPVLALAQDESLPAFDGMDVFDLEWVSDPQVSPNGNSVVYVRRSNDVMSDRTRSQLWRIDADGQSHRPLLSSTENAASPRWSPDGKRLAFVSSLTGSSQIHLRWMDNGDVAVVTHLQSSPPA